jgi:hypothetical protein
MSRDTFGISEDLVFVIVRVSNFRSIDARRAASSLRPGSGSASHFVYDDLKSVAVSQRPAVNAADSPAVARRSAVVFDYVVACRMGLRNRLRGVGGHL